MWNYSFNNEPNYLFNNFVYILAKVREIWTSDIILQLWMHWLLKLFVARTHTKKDKALMFSSAFVLQDGVCFWV